MPKSGYKTVRGLFGKDIEIPEEWKMDKLSNLGEPIIGLTYEPQNVKSDGILVLRSPNIQDGKLKFENNVYVDVELKEKLKIRKGDLLICVRNGSKRLIGKCAYINENFEKMTFGAFMSIFRSKENHFIYYQFQMPIIRKQITKSLTFTINQITNGNLNSFIITIPPIQEQQKIVSILSNIDNLIDSYDKTIQATKKLKKGLMQTLLTRGIGHKKFKTVKWLFGKEIEIPEEWEIENLKKSVEFHKQGLYTTIPYSKRGIKIARVNDLQKGNLTYEKMMCLDVDDDTFKSFQISVGNFLIARTGSIGNYAIVKNDIPCMHISDIIRFVFNKKNLVNDFFGLFFESSLTFIQLLMIQQSSSHIHINAETIKSLKIILPPIKEQQKIISIISSVDNEITKLELKKKSAESLKKGLMQKLLTGQIRVTV